LIAAYLRLDNAGKNKILEAMRKQTESSASNVSDWQIKII